MDRKLPCVPPFMDATGTIEIVESDEEPEVDDLEEKAAQAVHNADQLETLLQTLSSYAETSLEHAKWELSEGLNVRGQKEPSSSSSEMELDIDRDRRAQIMAEVKAESSSDKEDSEYEPTISCDSDDHGFRKFIEENEKQPCPKPRLPELQPTSKVSNDDGQPTKKAMMVPVVKPNITVKPLPKPSLPKPMPRPISSTMVPIPPPPPRSRVLPPKPPPPKQAGHIPPEAKPSHPKPRAPSGLMEQPSHGGGHAKPYWRERPGHKTGMGRWGTRGGQHRGYHDARWKAMQDGTLDEFDRLHPHPKHGFLLK